MPYFLLCCHTTYQHKLLKFTNFIVIHKTVFYMAFLKTRNFRIFDCLFIIVCLLFCVKNFTLNRSQDLTNKTLVNGDDELAYYFLQPIQLYRFRESKDKKSIHFRLTFAFRRAFVKSHNCAKVHDGHGFFEHFARLSDVS